jgi:hypothetical protein
MHSPNPLPFTGELKPTETLARGELIEHILLINPSASPEFLGRFTAEQLRSYVDHLSRTQMPRGSANPWIRGKQPGVVAYKTPA